MPIAPPTSRPVVGLSAAALCALFALLVSCGGGTKNRMDVTGEFFLLRSTDNRFLISLRSDGIAVLQGRYMPSSGDDRMEQMEGEWMRTSGGVVIDFTQRVEFLLQEVGPQSPPGMDESDVIVEKVPPIHILLRGDFKNGFVGGSSQPPPKSQWLGDNTKWRVAASTKDLIPQRHRKP